MAGFPRRPLKAQACGRSRGQQRQNKGDEATKGAASYVVESEGKEKQEQNAKKDEEIFLRATTNDTFPRENRRRADGNCRRCAERSATIAGDEKARELSTLFYHRLFVRSSGAGDMSCGALGLGNPQDVLTVPHEHGTEAFGVEWSSSPTSADGMGTGCGENTVRIDLSRGHVGVEYGWVAPAHLAGRSG